ncbi:hypothetical protein C7N43_26550, partial [Sphingobacteriales bacterium UPWRP_1]
MINITQMLSKPTTPSGDWLPAFYEAQLRLAQNISGGGIIYFPPGNYYFQNTLQIFGAPIIRGAGINNTRLIVKAPYEQHPFNANLLKPVDGMIIHFNAGNLGTGRLVNLPLPNPVPRIAPDIITAANWPTGFTAELLAQGNFVTNATPVLEHFSLIYEEHPGNQPLFHNSEDPRLGFGHG